MTRFNFRLLQLLLLVVYSSCLFERLNWLERVETKQKNYGVAVANVDLDDSDFEIIVAGFSGANLVLKFNPSTEVLENIAKPGSPYSALRDIEGKAIGVCACDIDGDGKEEIYFLNTNNAYAGKSEYGDKLFKWRDGRYVDIFSEPPNNELDAKKYAGRSVACIDHMSNGKYSIAVATYSQEGSGKFALIQMDENHPSNSVKDGYIVLKNVASETNIAKATGGRGIVVGPIISKGGRSDIFFNNEGSSFLKNAGANFLFKEIMNGSYINVAFQLGLEDEKENGRGVCLADLNKDGNMDIVYGNWDGKHRIFIQGNGNGRVRFENIATREFETPSLIRNVICADFDNDANTEIFMNNIYSRGNPQPNKLYKVTSQSKSDIDINPIWIGDAVEDDGCGTGAAVVDIDNDGTLELIISHGEDQHQPLQIYKVAETEYKGNNWIRFYPKTKYGAPARGAKVSVEDSDGRTQTQVIDGGSAYLCQMEPVAHFGLSSAHPVKVTIFWPHGRYMSRALTPGDVNKLHVMKYPSNVDAGKDNDKNGKQNDKTNKTKSHDEL